MIIEEDIYLEHFGVKGMKWGVRNEDESGDTKRKFKDRGKMQKAAIILGSAALAGTIVVGALYAKKHFNLKLSDLPIPKKRVKNFSSSLAKEPVDIIHVSRGSMRGYTFLRSGGMKDAIKEFDEAGYGDSKPAGWFVRYGKNLEKVAACFADPKGRRDHAGREVVHSVVLPKEMAKNVNSAEDVKNLVWNDIKDVFDGFYYSREGDYGPAF